MIRRYSTHSPVRFPQRRLIGAVADPCHTTVRAGPYTAVRVDAFESPTDRALAFARYPGPRPLPAVLLASGSRTPNSNSAARRRRSVFSRQPVTNANTKDSTRMGGTSILLENR
jgi:hypothetical protein